MDGEHMWVNHAAILSIAYSTARLRERIVQT